MADRQEIERRWTLKGRIGDEREDRAAFVEATLGRLRDAIAGALVHTVDDRTRDEPKAALGTEEDS